MMLSDLLKQMLICLLFTVTYFTTCFLCYNGSRLIENTAAWAAAKIRLVWSRAIEHDNPTLQTCDSVNAVQRGLAAGLHCYFLAQTVIKLGTLLMQHYLTYPSPNDDV